MANLQEAQQQQKPKGTTFPLSSTQSHLRQVQKPALNVHLNPLKFRKSKIFLFPRRYGKITTCSRPLHRFTYLTCRSCWKTVGRLEGVGEIIFRLGLRKKILEWSIPFKQRTLQRSCKSRCPGMGRHRPARLKKWWWDGQAGPLPGLPLPQ